MCSHCGIEKVREKERNRDILPATFQVTIISSTAGNSFKEHGKAAKKSQLVYFGLKNHLQISKNTNMYILLFFVLMLYILFFH